MKNLKKPAFILGIIGALLLFIGLAMKTYNDPNGNLVLYAGIVLGGIFWIWAISEVIATDTLKPFQKRFWIIIVLSVPVVGGLLYHILHQQRNKIVT
jgi:hypothetical protein